jgi:hypothetical protein
MVLILTWLAFGALILKLLAAKKFEALWRQNLPIPG